MLPCALSAKKKNPDLSDSEYYLLAERADSAIKKEDYNLAIDLLEKAMRTEPGNPGNVLLLSNKGMLHYYIGQDSIALATLNATHQMAPSSVAVLMNRAKIHNGIGNYADALVDYTTVTQLDSTLCEAWIQKGMLQLQGGDVRGAESSFTKADDIDNNSKDTMLAWAILYSKTNRPEKAIPYLNKVIKKEKLSEYYAERALCRLRIDDLSGAADDIADGLAIDLTNPDLYIARALLNRRRFREKDAINDATTALNHGADPNILKSWGFEIGNSSRKRN